MRKILYILTILVFGATYAQEYKTSDCNLQTENQLWKTEFEKAEFKSERIELIKATKSTPKKLTKAFMNLLIINTIVPIKFAFNKFNCHSKKEDI
ncbi:MAG: DUF2851 family protein, partial [Formosa sp.]|nr:DUF2851 family protein [Formosa sp.]